MSWQPAASINCRTMHRSRFPGRRAPVARAPVGMVLPAGQAARGMVKATAGVPLPVGVQLLESVASLYSPSGCDVAADGGDHADWDCGLDRKSTRLNSSH